MDSLRRLSTASTVATVLLISIGGLVRATKSGLGCGTHWPECSGKLVPALANRALVIEYSHRLAAAVVVVLLAALALLAVKSFRHMPKLLWASLGAFGLVMFQAVLGAIVVKLELEAGSVVLHLTTALLLVAVLLYITITAHAAQGKLRATADGSLSIQAWFTGASVLLLMVVGSYVTGRRAGLAFTDWPLMSGELLPDLGTELQAIHFLHRALAALVGAGVIVFARRAIRRRDEARLQARLAHVAVGLFAVEVLIGALNVWTRLNAAAVTLHLLTGTLIWTTLVGIALVSRPALAAYPARRKEPERRAALETSS
ncbi:MAG: COX15/CtaA family protein [Actinomycetota bacterium]